MLKDNINRLDNQLKSIFDEVRIDERAMKSEYYFDITVSKISEGKKVSVRLFASKPQFENNSLINWKYLSDTREDTSFAVERVSKLDELANDINDVIVNKKLDKSYLESLQEVKLDILNESVTENDVNELVSLLSNFEMQYLETHSKIEDHVMTELAHFKHNLKLSDKTRVELALKTAGYEDFMWNKDRLFVKYYL
jgi:hypothetical protein